MHEDTVRTRAFAMPLGSPAYPIGPYRFRNREYLIITYRTDPERLRAVVPEPLEVAEPLVKYEFIRMPDSTASAITPNRPDDPSHVSGQEGRLCPLHVLERRSRRSPGDASRGGFRRSWPVPACARRSTCWSAPWTTIAGKLAALADHERLVHVHPGRR